MASLQDMTFASLEPFDKLSLILRFNHSYNPKVLTTRTRNTMAVSASSLLLSLLLLFLESTLATPEPEDLERVKCLQLQDLVEAATFHLIPGPGDP